MAASIETTGLSLDAQQDARDQADYLNVPQVFLWLIGVIALVVYVDWLAGFVRPKGLKSNKVRPR